MICLSFSKTFNSFSIWKSIQALSRVVRNQLAQATRNYSADKAAVIARRLAWVVSQASRFFRVLSFDDFSQRNLISSRVFFTSF